jgi:glucose/arabinose dehydrogenase
MDREAPHKRSAMRPSLLLIMALLVAACGGGGGGTGATPPPGAPSATLTAPADRADETGAPMELRATAAGSVDAVEFEVDGVAVGSDASAPYGVIVDAADHAPGQHVVRARARGAGGVSAWSSATVRFGSGTAPPGIVRDAGYVSGLDGATAFAPTPDGRWLVAEQGGALRVVKGGVLLAAPFVQLGVDARGERGLIGVAVDPDFAANGFVYLHYTTSDGVPRNVVSRMRADGDVAAPGSEEMLVELPALSQATNHNGGALHFGADGKLYIGVGENAQPSRAQDLSSPLGKLLRVNADGGIPGDNPFFATQSGLARAVWAYGLRNPFTFAVQPGSGRIHINDVGQDAWEEIDLGAAGANYGWPASEGPEGVTSGIVAPLFAYAHEAADPPGSGPGGFFTGFSIAGGAFYPTRGGSLGRAYRGDYFFADFVGRYVGRLDLDDGNAASAFGVLDDSPVDVRVASDGALLVLTRGGITRFAAVN